MQYTNYRPGYYYPRDNVVNLTGNSQSIPHSDIACNSSRGLHLAFPPFMVDESQDVVYQKEILRQTILKHDATFRYQVNELHRLYGRQRELMDEMTKRELGEDHIHLQASKANTFVSLFRSDISEKTFRHSVNLTSIEPYAPSKEMFQDPFSSGADKTVQPRGDCLSGQNILNECKPSSMKDDTSRKRMLDLELPAEKAINNEYREQFEEENPAAKKTNILISELQPQCSSKVNLVASGNSSSSPSSCRGTFLLFDLNEPVQPFESECPNSAFESNNIHEEIRVGDLDLSGMARAECSTLNKEGRDESNLKSFDEVSSVGRALLPCNQPASLPLENVDKIHAETTTDKSLVISSWREFKQIPVAVQALSCFNTDASFSKSTESSVRNSSLTAKKLNMDLGPASTPTSGSLTSCFIQHDASDSTGEHIAAVEDNKFSDYTSSGNGMDLNLTPSTCLSDCQSAPSFDISHLNFPEGRNVEIHKNSEVPDSNMVPNSTAEYRKCTRDNHLVGSRIDSKLSTANICINLNSCIKEDLKGPSEATKSTAERDLKGPVSPENKECSPPRGDSEDINIRTSIHLPRRGHDDPIEEPDTVAADILIFISSSVVHRYSKNAIGEPSETSSNCLRGLAEVATSLASSQGNEVEQSMEVHFGRDVLLSERTASSRMKLNLRKGHMDNSLSYLKVAKKKEKGIVSNQPRRGQAWRTKDQKDLQADVLPAVESLLHQVNETSVASKPSPWKKTPSRTSCRGRRRSNDGERTMCSLLLQHTLDNKHGITDRFLKGWGVTKKRQRTRRAKSYVSPLFLAAE